MRNAITDGSTLLLSHSLNLNGTLVGDEILLGKELQKELILDQAGVPKPTKRSHGKTHLKWLKEPQERAEIEDIYSI